MQQRSMNFDDLIEDVVQEFGATADFTGRRTPSHRLMLALGKVPRDAFVRPEDKELAFLDTALPIGFRQTISQPFIVAIMTDLLDLTPESTVLEIGTGSGYQAAVLAELAAKVFTIEVIPELAERARATLKALRYRNIKVRTGDGYRGWPEAAPFDGIIVTAAAAALPKPLLDQLAPGGRMVIPVGPSYSQVLTVVSKTPGGVIQQQRILPVAFVPFVRAAGDATRPDTKLLERKPL